MTYFCDDRGSGERQVYDTEADALEAARIALSYYRKEAQFDGEWDMSVEDLTAGRVAPSGDPDDDIVTHRTRFIPAEEDTFDVEIQAVTLA